MAWKIKPEDLLPTHLGAKGQFGSRFSLGRLSLPVMKKDVVVHVFFTSNECIFFPSFQSMGSMESKLGCAEAKKQLFVKTAMFKVIYFLN